MPNSLTNIMLKRIIVFFSSLMIMFCALIFILGSLSGGEQLCSAANNQRSYKLEIASVRGTIYDCKNIPLVNTRCKLIAAVVPEARVIDKLTKIISENALEKIREKFLTRMPFKIEVNKKISDKNIDIFEVPIRFTDITPASHMVGYLSGDDKGISGIEKAYDEILSNNGCKTTIKYSVDALNKLLPGAGKVIENKSYLYSKGVVLNIDKQIQELVEEVGNKYFSKGSIVLCEVPNCEIRAAASFPNFSQKNIVNYLDDKNSPLLNRSLCQYNLGSIFKLVTAAAALESGISEHFKYNCKGFKEVEDYKFRCYNGRIHELLDMEEAVAKSCNGYFIELINHIGREKILNLCNQLGFGAPNELAPGLISAKGNLPDIEKLKNPKVLAHLAFGQGELLATPIQVVAFINAVASKGMYSTPKLVKGLISQSMNLEPCEYGAQTRVLKESTAEKLKKFMFASLDHGTSNKGKPTKTDAAAKTSTAETGIIVNDKKIEQAWFAGFFPLEKPKYCLVILAESRSGNGSENCGPIFKEIVDELCTKTMVE